VGKDDRGKTQVADESKKVSQQPRGDKGASSFGSLQYVAVVPQASAREVINTDYEGVVPKDLSSSSFSFALNNVTDSVPQGVLPIPSIPVLDLVTVDEHDVVHSYEDEGLVNTVSKEHVQSSPSVFNVEHVDVHEENVSPVQVIPSNNQSMVDQAATTLDKSQFELAVAHKSVQ